MVLSLALFFSYCYYSNAQDIPTTPNLVQPQGWQGCLDKHPGWVWGGVIGGPCPVQRAGDGAILFSWGPSTLSQTHAVNQALSGTGIQIRGYEYGWTIKNSNAGSPQNPYFDPLEINVSLYNNTNKQILESKTYDYNFRINDWTRFTGTEEYKNRYSLAAVGNITLSISGRDAGYWAGYYGPEINDISLRLRYSVNICAASPLNSPDCPGYQEAYKTQQCTVNPLYDSGCPGYTEAYLQLQCSSNSLYSPSCPGYQIAYQEKLKNDACRANPQSSPSCSGYNVVPVIESTSNTIVVNSNDPVAAEIETPVTNDLIVNQTLAAPKDTIKESTTQPLGTGLSVPGLRIPLQSSRDNLNRAVSVTRSATTTSAIASRDAPNQPQDAAIATMASVPGFDIYQNTVLPDAQFYVSRDIYRGVTIQDNARAQRALSRHSDRLHQEMINEQYRR